MADLRDPPPGRQKKQNFSFFFPELVLIFACLVYLEIWISYLKNSVSLYSYYQTGRGV
uniref:Uncharacterized protein n=1 Tax=Rhizophora mucronata TaxID=61149 RepID=A0A2P2R201_RHIMU